MPESRYTCIMNQQIMNTDIPAGAKDSQVKEVGGYARGTTTLRSIGVLSLPVLIMAGIFLSPTGVPGQLAIALGVVVELLLIRWLSTTA